MSTVTQVNDLFAGMTGKAVATFTLWADMNQRVLRELVDLSATTAKEGVRLYGEMQAAAVQAVRDGQSLLLNGQSSLEDAASNPLGFCQKTVTESAESAQKAFRLLEGNAQAITRSAERLQATAEQAGNEIQGSVIQLASRLKQLYAPVG
jgi:hypothetical protein